MSLFWNSIGLKSSYARTKIFFFKEKKMDGTQVPFKLHEIYKNKKLHENTAIGM